MKIVGDVNKVSSTLQPKKLARGEVVRYQLLTGNVNPDPTTRALNPFIFPKCNSIPSLDRIWDEEAKRHVDIALVETYDKDKNITTRPIIIYGQSTGGSFSCTGGNVREEELYEHLELLNCNESNPNRDTSVEPIFKRIDEVKDSRVNNKKRGVLVEALVYVNNLTDKEVKQLAASLNWNENLPEDVLRDMLGDFAQKKPADFMKHVEDKSVEVKAVIKQAITIGAISYDVQTHKMVLVSTGQTLMKFDRTEGSDYLTQAAEYILHNKKGQAIFDTVKKLLNPSSDKGE